jgi:tetratricopeptide (TPR) repeat protein
MPESDQPTLLETPKRLSRSKIWDLQRAFFERQGPRAWAQGIVPSGVSSNPNVAESYAHLIVAFLRDCANGATPPDPSEPVYVVDLGSGSGRLAYLLARALARLRDALPAGLPPTTVVATDFAEPNLEWMRTHSAMQPLVEAGEVDFAHFDAASPTTLELLVSGARLEASAVRNPVVVVANYFFDSIPTDAFRVQNGKLYEVLVALKRKSDFAIDPTWLEHYELEVEQREVVQEPYPDPLLNQILEGYRLQFEDTGLWFPVAAIDCLQHFAALSDQPTLLLLGDKAYRTPREMEDRPTARLALHGSLSVMVNAHAIEQVVQARGGFALHARSADTRFTHSLFLAPGNQALFPETTLAFATSIQDFGPREAYQLLRLLGNQPDLTPRACLQLIRLSGYDPWAYGEYFRPILKAIDDAPVEVRLEIREVLERVQLGCGYHAFGGREPALQWYRQSLEREVPRPETWHNIAKCLDGVDREDAIAAYQRALALDPELEEARSRLEELQAETD